MKKYDWMRGKDYKPLNKKSEPLKPEDFFLGGTFRLKDARGLQYVKAGDLFRVDSITETNDFEGINHTVFVMASIGSNAVHKIESTMTEIGDYFEKE